MVLGEDLIDELIEIKGGVLVVVSRIYSVVQSGTLVQKN
jgi:hypothetical protein